MGNIEYIHKGVLRRLMTLLWKWNSVLEFFRLNPNRYNVFLKFPPEMMVIYMEEFLSRSGWYCLICLTYGLFSWLLSLLWHLHFSSWIWEAYFGFMTLLLTWFMTSLLLFDLWWFSWRIWASLNFYKIWTCELCLILVRTRMTMPCS